MRDDFVASVERTLWFQVGAFGLSFLLMLALPRGVGRKAPERQKRRATKPLAAVAEGD